MRKVALLLLALFAVSAVPAYAVLKEKDLSQTVSMLRLELENHARESSKGVADFNKERISYWRELQSTLRYSDELAIVLYSQQPDYRLGLIHACREMLAVYSDFSDNQYPFERWRSEFSSETDRYMGLKHVLANIPDSALSITARADKAKAEMLCDNFVGLFARERARLESDRRHYEIIASRMKFLDNYTLKKFNEIKESIYVHGSGSYSAILSNFGMNVRKMSNSVSEVFGMGQLASGEWARQMLRLWISTIVFLLLAYAAVYCLMRWCLPGTWTKRLAHNIAYYRGAFTLMLFALIMQCFSEAVFHRSFFISASSFVIEYSTLCCIVLLSLAIRLPHRVIGIAMHRYLSLLGTGFIIMLYRIFLATNEVLNLTLVPFLALAVVVSVYFQLKQLHKLPRFDNFLTWTATFTIIASFVLAWIGFRLLSVQILMLLAFFVMGTLSMSCISYLVPRRKPWVKRLMSRLVMPVLTIMVLEGSVLWTAHIFDISSWVESLFVYDFINIANVAVVSLYKLTIVAVLAFGVNYALSLTRDIIHYIYGAKSSGGTISLTVNIITIVVWGLYLVTVILILAINKNGIVAAFGGMGMGIGFALKDTLTNLFYGISLMMGRVNIGDIVECDGIRGKIVNIDYQSTLIETIDGSIIAFLNSQLFTKNFKNLTRNHGYELSKIAVGVSYSTEVKKARELILLAAKQCLLLRSDKEPIILLDNFGENSLDLQILVWTPVAQHLQAMSN